MDVLEELHNFNKEIVIIEKTLWDLNTKRIKWCMDNRNEIKKLYPKKDKVYQIKDICNALWFCPTWLISVDEVYFFKAKDVRFTPTRDFQNPNSKEMPTVNGVVLDSNLNEVYDKARVYIDGLVDIIDEPNKLSENITQVYIMIDKNTGFYKIGRSKNPERREKTLQSEKPTIEMLFKYDARVKDEGKLHDMFSDKRVRGEWFDLSGTDLIKVGEYFNNNNYG